MSDDQVSKAAKAIWNVLFWFEDPAVFETLTPEHQCYVAARVALATLPPQSEPSP